MERFLEEEKEIESLIKNGGRFGKGKAQNLVRQRNLEHFLEWDEELLGDKRQHLEAKAYCKEFFVNPSKRYDMTTDCVNEDCVEVAAKLKNEGLNPAILNLASAVHPCGGYNKGWSAQEESLCYVSTLSQVLYQYGTARQARGAGVEHRCEAYPLDRNFGGIYAPCVRFFRKNSKSYFAFREQPFDCSVITVASLANRAKDEMSEDETRFFNADGTMNEQGLEIERNKIRTIFRLAVEGGNDSLVLGAFGCGAYHLLPSEVSALFEETLKEEEFDGAFKKVVFAIFEGKGKRGRITGKDGWFGPFYERFAKN